VSNKTVCPICGDEKHHSAHFCRLCSRLIIRMGIRKKAGAIIDMKSREKALKQAWDGEGFRCCYTDFPIEEDNPKSTKYMTFS